MEMINRCLEVSEAKRAEIEAFDLRSSRRKEMIAMRADDRSPENGNRKARRRLAAQQRQLEKAKR